MLSIFADNVVKRTWEHVMKRYKFKLIRHYKDEPKRFVAWNRNNLVVNESELVATAVSDIMRYKNQSNPAYVLRKYLNERPVVRMMDNTIDITDEIINNMMQQEAV